MLLSEPLPVVFVVVDVVDVVVGGSVVVVVLVFVGDSVVVVVLVVVGGSVVVAVLVVVGGSVVVDVVHWGTAVVVIDPGIESTCSKIVKKEVLIIIFDTVKIRRSKQKLKVVGNCSREHIANIDDSLMLSSETSMMQVVITIAFDTKREDSQRPKKLRLKSYDKSLYYINGGTQRK